MANQEHVEKLRKGARAWNVWRGKQADVPALSEANLSEVDLSGADLRGAKLPRASLGVADLDRANLSGANLSGAELSKEQLVAARTNVYTTPPKEFRR